MSIETILDIAGETIIAVMGVDATYTPAGGDAVSLLVLFDTVLEYQVEGFESQSSGSTRTVEALLSDLGQVPARDDTFLVDGITYSVTHIIENDGRFIKSAVK